MKNFFLLFVLILFSRINYTNEIYIPPGSCMTVPTGSNVCADTITVDVGACFIAGDSTCICPGIVFRGGGIIIIAVNQIGNSVPTRYELYQNYPNPFNPTTKIRFALPKNSFAMLVVYDMLGRELETLINEQLNAGTYEADWSADKFSSGVYYYKLVAGGFVETKKMVLVK